MKNFKKIMMLLPAVIFIFSACSKDDEKVDPNAGKAKIVNLKLTPESGLKYGELVTLTASLSDETGLTTYTLQISDAGGVIYEDIVMLTGKSFDLNKQVIIPLPKDASPGDLTFSLTVKNAGNQLTTEEIELKSVAVPTFDKLYLVMNNMVYEMTKEGNLYVFEDFVPAEATGKIYTSAEKTGLFWGFVNGEIQTMGADDIPLGREEEEYFKISFNPSSFVMERGANMPWNPLTGEDFFVLGTISGNWEDNAEWMTGHVGIVEEMDKMMMTAQRLGNRKMWTWQPTEDMWGNTVAGAFRLKKSGKEEYITYSNKKIETVTVNNMDNNFLITGAGGYSIRVMADETGIISVKAYDENLGRSVEYKNNDVLVHGMSVMAADAFVNLNGNALSLRPGNYFVYEGTLNLTKDAMLDGGGLLNLSLLFCDPDIFSAYSQGNATWQFTGPTGDYYFKVDLLSGNAYFRNESEFPDVIYVDGWGVKKWSGDPRADWRPDDAFTLYRQGTTNVYEGTFCVAGWGIGVKFFTKKTCDNNDGGLIHSDNFVIDSYYSESGDGGIEFPNFDGWGLGYESDFGYFKVTVDLKDGITEGNEPVGAKFIFKFDLIGTGKPLDI